MFFLERGGGGRGRGEGEEEQSGAERRSFSLSLSLFPNAPARLRDLRGGPQAPEGRAGRPEAISHVAGRGGRCGHFFSLFL